MSNDFVTRVPVALRIGNAEIELKAKWNSSVTEELEALHGLEIEDVISEQLTTAIKSCITPGLVKELMAKSNTPSNPKNSPA